MKKRKCKTCGNLFDLTRTDKQFCNGRCYSIYYNKHRDQTTKERREACRKSYHKHKEQRKQKAKNYRIYLEKKELCNCCGKKSPEKGLKRCIDCNRKNRLHNLRCYKKIKDEVYSHYGGYNCVCCGETESLFLTIDHINNDGSKHRKSNKITSTNDMLYWLKRNNYPLGFQILCWNCQQGKRFNNGICPHKTKGE